MPAESLLMLDSGVPDHDSEFLLLPADQLEFQIQDRIPFLSVLALSLDDTRPEAKTIRFFRPQLTPAGRSEKLFQPWAQFRLRKGKWLIPAW